MELLSRMDSSVSAVTRLRTGHRRGKGLSVFATASKLVLGSAQLLIQQVAWAPSLGVKRPGREAEHSLHQVLRLRIRAAILSLAHKTSRHDA